MMTSKFSTISEVASFCKEKGFVFPSSEIYGGFSAVYDYGPYGVELKNNIANWWWETMVTTRRDIVGVDSGICTARRVWEASGHADGFDDPQIDCRRCKARHRADILLATYGLDLDKAPVDQINKAVEELANKEIHVSCPACGSRELTPARQFSLMVKTNLGAPTSALTNEDAVFLRPESCQGIFTNFLNVLNTTRLKIPFGIAQIGKAFRNEIVARQFVFRTREFEQMEMQFFTPETEAEELYEQWRTVRRDWFRELGVPPERLRYHPHTKLAHYANAACDIEYRFSCLGEEFQEVEGIHMRGDWDLSRHREFSGAKLHAKDVDGNTFIPHVVETSAGLNRTFLCVLDQAFRSEPLPDGKSRNVLKLHPRLAPVKVAVFPLVKNRPALVEFANQVFEDIAGRFAAEYDDHSNIGKRYRRQDEIGTPLCVTIDFETLETGEVTVRDRDTMEQVRVPANSLSSFVGDRIDRPTAAE